MSQPQLQRLIKMINQIALNMSANGDPKMVGYQVAQHLEKFWSPPMKNLITEQPIDAQTPRRRTRYKPWFHPAR